MKEFTAPEDTDDGYVLACQARPKGAVRIEFD